MNVSSAASAARYASAFGTKLGKPEGGAAPRTPKYTFDPFDQKTWDVKTPDAKPAAKADDSKGTTTGTGVVVAKPKYAFDPFDQKTWDVKAPKGSHVDVHA